MKTLHVRVWQAGQLAVEFNVRGADPVAMREQLRAACVVAGSLGYESASVEDADGNTVELPIGASGIEVARLASPITRG